MQQGQAIASMGYPDIIFPPDRLATQLGERIKDLKYREDWKDICKRHGVKGRQIPDSESLFELYGVSLDVYDVTADRGDEIILDLNHPYPANSKEQYDYVLDVGTLEHCFNVGQALFNMAAMVRVGGWIFHENPWNWGNHGFYAFNPTLYYDFYEANGFEIEDCRLIDRGLDVTDPIDTKRFTFSGDEVVLLTIAKRVEVKPFAFPTQRKYQEKSWEK